MKTKIKTIPGKVYRINRGNCLVKTDDLTLSCDLSINGSKNYNQQNDETCPVAIGDIVDLVPTADGIGEILYLNPRINQFSRQSTRSRGRFKQQVIASNIDCILAVFSTVNPKPKWRLLDRILVAAEVSSIKVIICISKIDLLNNQSRLNEEIKTYRDIGYPVVMLSSKTGQGFTDLQERIRGKSSILVGKSGVGKSSILNELDPGLGLKTQDTSKIQKGRHTTTGSVLYDMPFGGMVGDTPGFREFSPWDVYSDELSAYFREMRSYTGKCKFKDCNHDEEPGCAVRKAVMAGKISPHRYQSFLRLKEELI